MLGGYPTKHISLHKGNKDMKKLYVAPKICIVNVSLGNMLTMSSCCGEKELKRENCLETCCPFNHEWCVDKQKRFNAWRKAVWYASKNHTNTLFITHSKMFDGCPHGYKSLCAGYKIKQR